MPGIDESNFSRALAKLASRIGMHSAMQAALSKLFSYTSDEDGVRHAIVDAPGVDFAEAKFLLVACSAFVNYLIAKSDGLGAVAP
jgi:hypothetical protein